MAAFSKPNGIVGMLFTVTLLLQAVVASSHGHGHAHMHVVHRSPEVVHGSIHKRADNIAVKGADGIAYPRLEIRELQKNEDQFNLYILAMENFMAKPKTDALSYYQIAGIHGRPYIPWNEPGPLKHVAGYCTHVSILFGTWHRPYLALFEQALYASAKEVVSQFPANEQAKWNAALTGFRMPYFDWAIEPTVEGEYVPKIIRDEQISVTKPSGKVTIKNPLYAYSFGDSIPSEMGWAPVSGSTMTIRHPVGTKSNEDEFNEAFGQARVGWRQRVFALLASKQNWGLISSSQYGVKTARQNTDSYEAVHDEIHGTTGGTNGYMSYLDVAAFDPMFFLHHTNMDRLLQMHSILTPDTWVANGTLNTDTAQWNAGEMKDENTPLKPFMKDTSGAYFTSRDVKDTLTLGYYYPETKDKDVNTVISAINKLYGQGEKAMAQVPSSSSSTSSAPSSAPTMASSLSVSSSSSSASSTASSSSASSSSASSSSASSSSASSSSASSSSASSSSAAATSPSAAKPTSGSSSGSGNTVSTTKTPFPGRPFKDGDYDTVLSVVGDKYGMPGAYKVYCFLGNKPFTNNSSTKPSNTTSSIPSSRPNSPVTLPNANATAPNYYSHPDYVGSHTFLGGSVVKNSSNPVLVEGSIPLTACLQGKIESGELKSLHPEHVEPYLAKNLHYKIVGPNGQEMQPEKVPNFHAKVKSCPVAPATQSSLPTYKEYVELPKVDLPASQPWTPPKPVAQVSPVGSMTMPWDEQGYCVSSQTVEYVDSNGKLLYTETH